MQPESHAFVIRAAVEGAGEPWLERHLADLLAGNRDEDDWVLGPFRLRAPGLTHTFRPDSARGELGAPSARTCLLRCVARARSAQRDAIAARWLGRACHLLGDMAVPARTRGVWHLSGDPLEAFWEANLARWAALSSEPHALLLGSPAAYAESLAAASSAFEADTTCTPWGNVRHRLFGGGRKLDEDTIERQAQALFPARDRTHARITARRSGASRRAHICSMMVFDHTRHPPVSRHGLHG